MSTALDVGEGARSRAKLQIDLSPLPRRDWATFNHVAQTRAVANPLTGTVLHKVRRASYSRRESTRPF